MQLTDKSHLQAIMRSLEASAKRSLGQNFLVDKAVLGAILAASHLRKDDVVVEVGPGLGTLTEALVGVAGRVIAVEKDDLLYTRLATALGNPANLELVHADILQTNLAEKVTAGGYKVVANIPYYLTSPLIRYLLEEAPQPSLITLLVQKEVAQRVSARPGALSLLGISAQFYADVETIREVEKTRFWPTPKVDSAIIRLTPHRPLHPDAKSFFRLVKAGFSSKRKTLVNNLSPALQLEREAVLALLKKSHVNPGARAQELSLQQWVELTDQFAGGSYG